MFVQLFCFSKLHVMLCWSMSMHGSLFRTCASEVNGKVTTDSFSNNLKKKKSEDSLMRIRHIHHYCKMSSACRTGAALQEDRESATHVGAVDTRIVEAHVAVESRNALHLSFEA